MASSTAPKRRVMLVDDEPAATANLRAVLYGFDELEVVAEVRDGRTAIRKIVELRPDIVFLDIEMPEVNGFEVARATSNLNYQLIFVTAYSQYALDAFDTNAIDYLLKPVRPSVFEKCVRKMLFQEGLVLERIERERSNAENLILSDGRATRVVSRDHVCYVEGIGRYRRVHLDSHGSQVHRMPTILSDTTLDEFEELLASPRFVRLHRSYIANVSKAVSLASSERRHFLKLLDTDVLIPVSRTKITEVRNMIGR